ncbi:MAG: hypothetical protein FJ267_13645 [Planctomycetes bacterium]|nr:hypothetical protein [Planctomycetota bacterium]
MKTKKVLSGRKDLPRQWVRDPMVCQPYIHFIVPAGAVSDDASKWCGTPDNFLLPETVASTIYRQKFREALRDAELEDNVRWLV